MPAQTIRCAKLGRELPAIDETTPTGRQALKMAQLVGGTALRDRVRDHISAQAWDLWSDRMRMIINEYRLDPTSEQANAILREHMEAFLFGDEKPIDNYVPPA